MGITRVPPVQSRTRRAVSTTSGRHGGRRRSVLVVVLPAPCVPLSHTIMDLASCGPQEHRQTRLPPALGPYQARWSGRRKIGVGRLRVHRDAQ